MHAGVGVAEGGGADRGRAIPESGGRRCAARTLRDVFVDLQVVVMMAIAEALDGSDDQLRIEFLDALPGKAHPIECARAEVLDQHIGPLDQLFQHLLTLGLLGVQRERLLVAVEHREVQGVRIRNVTQLASRNVARAGPLHLDHVGTEPGQELRAGRARLHVGEIDDANAFQWLTHVG